MTQAWVYGSVVQHLQTCTGPWLPDPELQINKHKHGYLFVDLDDTKFVVSVSDTSRIT